MDTLRVWMGWRRREGREWSTLPCWVLPLFCLWRFWTSSASWGYASHVELRSTYMSFYVDLCQTFFRLLNCRTMDITMKNLSLHFTHSSTTWDCKRLCADLAGYNYVWVCRMIKTCTCISEEFLSRKAEWKTVKKRWTREKTSLDWDGKMLQSMILRRRTKTTANK